ARPLVAHAVDEVCQALIAPESQPPVIGDLFAGEWRSRGCLTHCRPPGPRVTARLPRRPARVNTGLRAVVRLTAPVSVPGTGVPPGFRRALRIGGRSASVMSVGRLINRFA